MQIAGISGGTVNLNITNLGNISSNSLSAFEKTDVMKYNGMFINNFHYGSEFISYNIILPIIYYGNDPISGMFIKNDCPSGYSGTSLTYNIEANRFRSTSKEAANLLAQSVLENEGQNNANNNGSCVNLNPIFYNVQQSGSATKNNCDAGYTGSTVTYIVPAGTYSGITQEIANNLAIADINSNGQTYANSNGSCIQSVFFYNVEMTSGFTKNDCDTSFYSGSSLNYTVVASTYSGNTQEEANNLAIADINSNGQTYANTNGTCVQYRYGNIEMTRTFTSNDGICPFGFTYDTGKGDVTYILHSNVYFGDTQEAADQLAISIIDDPNGPAINYARSQRCNHV